MQNVTWRLSFIAILVLIMTAAEGAGAAKPPGFVQTVEATHPLAFFRLNAAKGPSAAGAASYTSVGATVVSGAPTGVVGERALLLDGKTGKIDTTQMGGIGAAGSLMAWVNLSMLPAKAGRIIYVAGESQSGNDFDVQFESDNMLHFYTAAGSNLKYAPNPAALIHRWHMLVVTANFSTKARAMYWDGKVAATDMAGGTPNKMSEFTMGESSVFTGRFFPGAIDEVALWGRALSASDVSKIYASAKH